MWLWNADEGNSPGAVAAAQILVVNVKFFLPMFDDGIFWTFFFCNHLLTLLICQILDFHFSGFLLILVFSGFFDWFSINFREFFENVYIYFFLENNEFWVTSPKVKSYSFYLIHFIIFFSSSILEIVYAYFIFKTKTNKATILEGC